MFNRKMLNNRAEGYIKGAMVYLNSYPCAICMGERNKKCIYGVKYIGTCPVAKGIRNYLKEQNNG